MAPGNKSHFWRLCRIYFRRFRIGVLLTILALVGALVYLNQIGLPGFIKKPLLQKLRDRGINLQFTRLRWRWYHGIVADNVRFGRADDPASPKLAVKEVQVLLDYRALARLQIQVKALVLDRGELSWPILATNQPPRTLSISNIQTELRLLPGDLWELENFQARFAGADIQLTGAITNASAVRDWKLLQPRAPARPGAVQDQLRQLADTLEHIHFSTAPQLKVDVRGDAREPQSFSVLLALNAPDADTPWGTLQHGFLSVLLRPTASNAWSRADITLTAEAAQTRWAATTNLGLSLRLVSRVPRTNVVYADLDLTASNVRTEWGNAASVHFTAQWLHALTNPVPLSGHGELSVEGPQSRWGAARQLRLAANLFAPTNAPAQADESWAWWTNLAPYALTWEGQVRELRSPRLALDELSCAGDWTAPRLTVTRIAAALYGGRLDATAGVDVAAREVTFAVSSDFDAQKISPLLTEKSREWISQFSWRDPPVVKGEGAVVLPPWTNFAHADWHDAVRPTLRLAGEFKVANGSYRRVPFTSAQSHFGYSNLCWRLPDLAATRPEGRLDLVHEADERTQDFYFRIHSSIDARAVRPLLDPQAQRGLDLVRFTRPPIVDGELRGRWHEPDSIGFNARVALSNFTFRGESASDFQSAVEYTNRYLRLIEPRLHRGTQEVTAASVGVDFITQKVYLTNGFSTAEPFVVARAIGPEVIRAIESYRFERPPTARVQGIIPMHDESQADLHFDIEGGPFEWWKFHVRHVAGRVDWTGKQLALRSVQADFYRGNAVGNAGFDFSRGKNPDCRFDVVATDADFHLLMEDLAAPTNRLEGLLTARLSIHHGNMADRQSWEGTGRVNLRDGLIWEIPIFGIFSPVLDGIVPGLGSSRAKEGSATFSITNGIVHSDNLEIHASLMRLQYWGTVDLYGQLNARSEAELLRNTPVVGPVLSLALWPVSKIFEYKITGTVREPKADPVFLVPKIILMPFHPLRTLRGMIPEESGTLRTNTPPFQR